MLSAQRWWGQLDLQGGKQHQKTATQEHRGVISRLPWGKIVDHDHGVGQRWWTDGVRPEKGNAAGKRRTQDSNLNHQRNSILPLKRCRPPRSQARKHLIQGYWRLVHKSDRFWHQRCMHDVPSWHGRRRHNCLYASRMFRRKRVIVAGPRYLGNWTNVLCNALRNTPILWCNRILDKAEDQRMQIPFPTRNSCHLNGQGHY